MTSVIARWSQLPANIRGAGCIVVGGFLLIVMASIVKQLGQSLPAFEVVFVRFFSGLIVIFPLVWRLGFGILRTQRLGLHLTRGLVGFFGNLCFFFALIHMAIGETVTIQFSRPLVMVVIAGLFLGEMFDKRRTTLTIVGFGGVLLITRPFGAGFEPWALVALAGTVFATLVVITVKMLTRTEQTVVIMFYFAVTTTLLSLVPAVLTWQTPTWAELGLLFLTGFLGIVGQSLFTHGIGLGETSFVLPFDYLRIVYAFVIGMIWFAEVPDVWGATGATVIVASSLYLLKSEGRR
jgi:drug/metabolite transporter (DMT)-like permease